MATKLVKFLVKLLVGAIIWIVLMSVMSNSIYYDYFIFPLPFWTLVMFGVYSVSVVLYRTLNFNDCPEAAKELLGQIDAARADLKKKGMKSL